MLYEGARCKANSQCKRSGANDGTVFVDNACAICLVVEFKVVDSRAVLRVERVASSREVQRVLYAGKCSSAITGHLIVIRVARFAPVLRRCVHTCDRSIIMRMNRAYTGYYQGTADGSDVPYCQDDSHVTVADLHGFMHVIARVVPQEGSGSRHYGVFFPGLIDMLHSGVRLVALCDRVELCYGEGCA